MSSFDYAMTTLLVPNVKTVCLTKVAKGSAPTTGMLIFRHTEDLRGEVYEDVSMNFTRGANLPPQEIDGERKSVNLGYLRLISFMQAAGATEDEIREVMTYDRDHQVEVLKRFVGICVDCPMTGRVKGTDKVVRVQFKFGDVDWDNINQYVADQQEAFSESDLGRVLEVEAARERNTRGDDEVVPGQMQEGDELMQS